MWISLFQKLHHLHSTNGVLATTTLVDEPRCFSHNEKINLPEICNNIDFFWPIMDQYYTGTVMSGKFSIDYEDGDKEKIHMEDQAWRHMSREENCNNATDSLNEIPTEVIEDPATDPSTAAAHTSISTNLLSNMQPEFQSMCDHFGNQPFLKLKALGFPS